MARIPALPVLMACLAALTPAGAVAAQEDGFSGLERQLRSRFFNIYLKEGVDADRLAMRIAVPPSTRAMVYSSTSSFGSDHLEDQLDRLFLVVTEILEARMKQFESSVKVCESASGLGEVSERLFGREIKAGGFYVVALDSLYIDSENVTLYVLGHEMAHAVISKYFVVPPPERIQEVLAGYVEYELRKQTRSL